MKIKLLHGQQAMHFQEEGNRYVLWSAAQRIRTTVAEAIFEGAKRQFVLGRVEVLWLGRTSEQRTRVENSEVLCEDFYDGLKYAEALGEGFEVKRGAAKLARLLIKHKLAEEV